MNLTVEQKINLLILAGFEPKYVDAMEHTRIMRPDRTLWRMATGTWCIHVGTEYYGSSVFLSADWAELKIDCCPDELIYKACEL